MVLGMVDAAGIVSYDHGLDLQFREAGPGDARAIAGLHADSWRRHYRGAYSDSFLDGDVAGYLLTAWTGRLSPPDPQSRTIVAELGGDVVGLAHTRLGEDAAWGALLDNLHVSYELKRLGIGTRLLALTAQAVLDSSPASGLYLWVLEQNAAAQAFYTAQGGACVERRAVLPPGGDPSRLNGTPTSLRFVWRDPSKLDLSRI
jgi:ribosomal protein S18 acetylase RimI-like enzyme